MQFQFLFIDWLKASVSIHYTYVEECDQYILLNFFVYSTEVKKV